MHIAHINISAPKEILLTEKVFFCEIFGLKEGFRPKFKRNGFWLYAGTQAIVHLTESNAHFQNEKQGYLDHIAFQLTDLNPFCRKLEERGMDYQSDPLLGMGMRQIFFKSPAGVGLEVNFVNESR